MSRLSWYWHRLRAMSPGELARHLHRKLRQSADANRRAWPKADLTCPGVYPTLPKPEDAPDAVRVALRRDVDDILAGRWRFFGHLALKVDDPPKWQCDYLARQDLETSVSAFALNYRTLPAGADSKLIWEPSRWSQLVRLAMAAYVLNDRRAATKCLDWLEDWVRHNPPYRGWNWTSALEVGLRLIQFTWIDALLVDSRVTKDDLRAAGGTGTARDPGATADSSSPFHERLAQLRQDILPAHVWYAWRHRSFGSSANNHLLGELAGCIVATARWPGLFRCGASLETLGAAWRTEVFAQFAEDGGNREQGLHYHLFSWEFCWQAFKALAAAGRLSGQIEQRLAFAARFFMEVQTREDHWDYGDSDQGFVVPFFVSSERHVSEWHQWFCDSRLSPGLAYWLGDPPASLPPLKTNRPVGTVERGDWWYYPDTGIALAQSGYWRLRWDLSPLGYLKTAAHGHLDALHLSIWMKGIALIIDPGTGAYHADPPLRNWLASRAAHNAPAPLDLNQPARLGPFLWGPPHEQPRFNAAGTPLPLASLCLPTGTIRRSVRRLSNVDGWEVADAYEPTDGQPGAFAVRWQFAPGSWLKRHSTRQFELHRGDVAMIIEVDENWHTIELVEPVDGDPPKSGAIVTTDPASLEGVVSPGFRKTARAPFLRLLARPVPGHPAAFVTTFTRRS